MSVCTLVNGSIKELVHGKQQKLQKNYKRRYIAFCNFKNSIGSIQWPIPENPSIGKNLAGMLHKPSYSQFCPKFRCHGNHGGSGVKLNDTIRWPSPKTIF